MPFDIRTGCFPAEISDNHINPTPHIDTTPEMRVWEKIKTLFGHAQQSGALACIQTIYHPPTGITREDIFIKFELIKMLSHFGYEENIQSGRHGSYHLCILDANSHEILSVTLDDTGSYTLESEGHRKTYPLTTTPQQTAEVPLKTAKDYDTGSYTLECKGDRKAYLLTTTPQQMAEGPPKTAKDYDVIWSAWERAASPEEAPSRATVVQKLRHCLHDSYTTLELRNLNLTTLPDYLPPNILELEIENTSLASLPKLPSGLQKLSVRDISLIRLPKLPAGLQHLDLHTHKLKRVPALPLNLVTLKLDTLLTRIPELPLNLVTLMVDSQLTKMPELPSKLQILELHNTQFTSLPPLPSGLQRLQIADTKLTSLPESIASLPRETEVSLSNNPLTERTLLTLRNMTRASDYSGPKIHFSMRRAPPYRRTLRPPHLAVAD